MLVFRLTRGNKACSLKLRPRSVNKLLMRKVYQMLSNPLGWLFPARCLVCGDPGQLGQDLCRACHTALPWLEHACERCALPLPEHGVCGACLQHPSPLDAVHAAFDYRFPVDRLLPRLKFHRDFAAGRMLSQCVAAHFSSFPRPDALVPLPLHQLRLRSRGYNQALELAKPIAKVLQIPLQHGLLVRRRATAAQSTLDAHARQRNLRGAFALHPKARLPKRVVLFDDVMTTGATLHAAAQTLRQAGVHHVEAWVCARVA